LAVLLQNPIHIIRFYKNRKKAAKEMIANLNDIRKKIIGFFGNTAMEMYGLAVT